MIVRFAILSTLLLTLPCRALDASTLVVYDNIRPDNGLTDGMPGLELEVPDCGEISEARFVGECELNGDIDDNDDDKSHSEFGTTSTLADGNDVGIVDAADYFVGRKHLGAMVTSGPARAPPSLVPDSSTMGLLALLLAVLARRVRRIVVVTGSRTTTTRRTRRFVLVQLADTLISRSNAFSTIALTGQPRLSTLSRHSGHYHVPLALKSL